MFKWKLKRVTRIPTGTGEEILEATFTGPFSVTRSAAWLFDRSVEGWKVVQPPYHNGVGTRILMVRRAAA